MVKGEDSEGGRMVKRGEWVKGEDGEGGRMVELSLHPLQLLF